jgi:hypothetical protein
MKTTLTSKRLPNFRSGLERQIAADLRAAGISYRYEEDVVRYVKPLKPSRYTPDFVLPNGIIIEGKGQFATADRQKHLLVKDQHPDLDIRFVFSNPNQRISKQSKTTYAAWCEAKGFQYAKALVPDAWKHEAPNVWSLSALKELELNV